MTWPGSGDCVPRGTSGPAPPVPAGPMPPGVGPAPPGVGPVPPGVGPVPPGVGPDALAGSALPPPGQAWTAGAEPAWSIPASAPGAQGQWIPLVVASRRRPYRLLLGVCAAAVLVGGTAVAVATAVRVSPPRAVVEKYFAALRAGDAPAALGYGDTPRGDRSFLTSTALAAQNRLAVIGSVQVDAATVSGRTARVPVTYTLTPAAAPTRPSIQTTDVSLHRRGRDWYLDRTAAVVRVVPTGAGHRATLAGAAIPAGPVALFPGIVAVRYDTALIEQQLDSGYVTLTSTGSVKVGAQLSESGRGAVRAAVRTAFVRCLAHATARSSAACPLTPTGNRVVPGSLRGSLTATSFDVAPVLRGADADGLVEAAGSFLVDGRYQTLNFDNIARSDSGTVHVSFKAAVYATAPGAVRWERP